jgi:LAO/AO transport system kinase
MTSVSRAPLDRVALGRTLTRIANAGSRAALCGLIEPAARSARRIGITGAPGTGKSTLMRCLAAASLAQGRRVGVLAVDPSSPYSRGAILGDRIRMGDVATHPELFFRSLASRSAHDGLADNLAGILCAMESHDFDELLVETVGAGQTELAVRLLVDCVVLVLMPESGDQVQAMKAGVMEIADVLVVNKADLPGAAKIAAQLKDVVGLRRQDANRRVPPVILASQDDAASQRAVVDAIDAHCAWLCGRDDRVERARARAAYHAQSVLSRRIAELFAALPAATFESPLSDVYREVVSRLSAELEAPPSGEARVREGRTGRS